MKYKSIVTMLPTVATIVARYVQLPVARAASFQKVPRALRCDATWCATAPQNLLCVYTTRDGEGTVPLCMSAENSMFRSGIKHTFTINCRDDGHMGDKMCTMWFYFDV